MSELTKRALEQSLKNLLLQKPLNKITINDIAEMAGTSKTTVSFYLNGKTDRMSESTQKRIRKAIKDTGYEPSPLARGMNAKQSHLIGVIIGYAYACFRGQVDFSAIGKAAWVGLPEFRLPQVDFTILPMFIPVVLVLVAENVGHVKSVSQMTGRDYDDQIGTALFADGLGTTIAGFGGGSGTTTYGENIGVMAATKVYSTAAYWCAAAFALLLSLCPKFGAIINTIPAGVLGGVTTLLYGMIGMIGVRIWVENKVNFDKPLNIMVAAIVMIIGIADFTFAFQGVQFNGIAIGAGTDIAIESAGILLPSGNLEKLPELFDISRATIRTIRQNLTWALFYNLVSIPVAALGVLHPSICATAMSASSIGVLMHSLRLKDSGKKERCFPWKKRF